MVICLIPVFRESWYGYIPYFCGVLAPKWRRMNMKYLVLAELCIEDRDTWPVKAQKWAEVHGKYADKFPEFPMGLNFFANSSKMKGMAVWETDDPVKVARKMIWMLPEVSYELIPLIAAEDWIKTQMTMSELK